MQVNRNKIKHLYYYGHDGCRTAQVSLNYQMPSPISFTALFKGIDVIFPAIAGIAIAFTAPSNRLSASPSQMKIEIIMESPHTDDIKIDHKEVNHPQGLLPKRLPKPAPKPAPKPVPPSPVDEPRGKTAVIPDPVKIPPDNKKQLDAPYLPINHAKKAVDGKRAVAPTPATVGLSGTGRGKVFEPSQQVVNIKPEPNELPAIRPVPPNPTAIQPNHDLGLSLKTLRPCENPENESPVKKELLYNLKIKKFPPNCSSYNGDIFTFKDHIKLELFNAYVKTKRAVGDYCQEMNNAIKCLQKY